MLGYQYLPSTRKEVGSPTFPREEVHLRLNPAIRKAGVHNLFRGDVTSHTKTKVNAILNYRKHTHMHAHTVPLRVSIFSNNVLYFLPCFVRQECCQCCSLGLMAQAARLPCNLMNRFGTQCGTSFNECCEGTVLPTTLGPSINRTLPTVPTLVPINGKCINLLW